MTINLEHTEHGSSFTHMLLWFKNDYKWILTLPIIVVSFAVGFLSSIDFMGWGQDPGALKVKLEILHPGLLVIFVAISLYGWQIKKLNVSGWMALLGSGFLMREIHFLGSDYLMFLILIGTLIYAWKNPSKFTPFWTANWSLCLFVTCFMYYACSEALFDRALIEKPFEFAFNNPDWTLPHITIIEEFQESLGGFFLILSSATFIKRSTSENPA
jgi:hypothetical protein